MRLLRVASVAILLSVLFGFRTAEDRRWVLTPDQPVIWLDLDPKLYADEGFGDKVNELTGSLAGLKDLPAEEQRPEIWKLLVSDFNSIETAFVRFAVKPGQIESADATTHYTYDETYAETHTIHLEVGPSRGGSSGFSTPIFSGSTITDCKIVMAPGTLADPKFYKHVLSHEILHCLGLGHQQDDDDSIMSYSNFSQDLSVEEAMALTHLYPTDPEFGKEAATLGMACSPTK